MNNRFGYVAAATLSLLLAAAASAQSPPAPPPPPPGGGPPGGEGPRDATQFIDQLMANDANHDGKLSKDEVPAPLGERIFGVADADHDGFLTRDELVAFTKAQGPGRGPGTGPGGARGGQQPSFIGSMKQAERAAKALEESKFDAASKTKDLEAIQALEAGLVNAKGQSMTVPISAKAKAKFGEDKAAYESALRRQILKAISQAIAVETALMDGKFDEARAAFSKLEKDEDSGHSLFREDEAEAPPPPGRDSVERPAARGTGTK